LLRCSAGAPPSPASMLGVFPETPSARFCMGGSGGSGAVCESLGLLTAGYGGLTSEGSMGRSGLSFSHTASEDGIGSSSPTPTAVPRRRTSSGTLSASAAEFVPSAVVVADRIEEESQNDETPQKVELSSKSVRSSRAVLGEITNVMGAGAGGKIGKGWSPGSPVKAPLPSAARGNTGGLLKVFDDTASKPAAQALKPVPLKPGLVQGRENRPPPLLVYEDVDDEKDCSQTPCKQIAREERRERRRTTSEDSQEMTPAEDLHESSSGDALAEDGKLSCKASLSSCGLPPGLSPPRRPSKASQLAGILSTVPVQPDSSVASVAAGIAAAPRTWTPKSSAGPALLATTPQAAHAKLAGQKTFSAEPVADAPSAGCVWSREELLSHRIVVAKEIAAAGGKAP